MNLTNVAKLIAYGTCLFLTPFFFAAYFDPMAAFNLGSIGLEPMDTDRVVGLSNIRGSIGGLRLGIIAMIALGTFYQRRDMCLSAAILVAAVSTGRFISLAVDGWNLVSFITATYEVLITVSMLHLGGFLGTAAAQLPATTPPSAAG